jgi:ABC-type transporter Mla subunit MlaD
MADDQTPGTHRLIGRVALVLGLALLVFSVAMLASGNDSGRTEYSGLVAAAALLGVGAYEVARSRRGDRP